MMSVEQRELHFDSIDDALAEAESLASGGFRTSGNFSFGQILEHLSRVLDVVTGEMSAPSPPFFTRILGRVLKLFILRGPMKAGFNLPSDVQDVFWPTGEVTLEDGMQHFRESVERFKSKGPLPVHPFFGRMTQEQSVRLQCLHTALHLSFVHPASNA